MNTRYAFCALALTTLFACNSSEKQEEVKEEEEVLIPVKEERGIITMPEYDYQEELTVGQSKFSYSLHREPCDSMSVVEDENGDKYANNFYSLSIKRNEQEFFSHIFTKETFGSHLDATLLENGILDGFRYIEAKEGKLVFGVCISYPESDLSAPFFLTVATDGSFTIQPDNTTDLE